MQPVSGHLRSMFKRIGQLLADGWRSLLLLLTVIGVLYAWPDIRDLPEAYGYEWGQVVPDRETAALVVLGFALLWIVWIDVRPTIRRWMAEGKTHPLTLIPPSAKYIESEAITATGDSRIVYKEMYFVGVANSSKDMRILRNIQLSVSFMGRPSGLLPVRFSSGYSVDLHPGAQVYFTLCTLLTLKCRSLVCKFHKVELDELEHLHLHASHPSIHLPVMDNPFSISLEVPAEISTLPKFPLRLMFAADDMKPLMVNVTLAEDAENDVLFKSVAIII